jgi:hypothetical protein
VTDLHATIAQKAMCLAFAVMLSACDKTATTPPSTVVTPTEPTPPVACTDDITIGRFPNGAPASPGQGMAWKSYFESTVLARQASVYIVDINASPFGCLGGSWTAISGDRNAVQVSPAAGSGRGQVELFIPANGSAQRSTMVTIAGQTASITQRGE